MSNVSTSPPPSMRKVALDSFAGALMEWYDFFLFGTAAALVFGKVFFPGSDPAFSTIQAFATFGVGFVARPLGGIFFGHLGDRVGRKKTLIATLAIVGSCTFLIGLLPSHAAAGVWAPILLVILRLGQGFGLGGEYGGAALMVVEHAPAEKRGFWGSIPQASASTAILLSTGAFALVSLLPDDQLYSWGWRIPFLISVALLGIGLFIRSKISETPDFEQVKHEGQVARVPLVQVFRGGSARTVLVTLGARLAETVTSNLGNAFAISYISGTLLLGDTVPLNAMLVAAAIGIVVTPIFGAISDRVGRKPVYLAGALFVVVAGFPFFMLLNTKSTALICVALIGMYVFGNTLMFAAQATYFTELYGTNVRYTGLSLAFQGSALIGGLMPFTAAWLLKAGGGAPWLVAGMLVLTALITTGCLLVTKETHRPGAARHAQPAEPVAS
ncbi:MAG: MFS transporter [Streptosporangiales bacterium]|nr:MFS transporter [Streptosporangiales bacterium]